MLTHYGISLSGVFPNPKVYFIQPRRHLAMSHECIYNESLKYRSICWVIRIANISESCLTLVLNAAKTEY